MKRKLLRGLRRESDKTISRAARDLLSSCGVAAFPDLEERAMPDPGEMEVGGEEFGGEDPAVQAMLWNRFRRLLWNEMARQVDEAFVMLDEVRARLGVVEIRVADPRQVLVPDEDGRLRPRPWRVGHAGVEEEEVE